MENEMTNDAAVAIQRYDYTDPVYADYSYFGKVEGGEFVRYSDHATTVAELRAEIAENEGVIAVWRRRAEAAERRVAELEAGLASARRAIGDHHAPNDCYATGPLTGDEFLDLVQCPACAFFDQYAALTKESP